jgi:RecB family endonuclease NucS
VTPGIDPPATLVEPAVADALALVETAVERDHLVTLAGRCTAEYRGDRATGTSTGDRVVVVKPDGTLLVHADAGYQPVAWQPTGADLDARVADDSLVLDARHPDDALTVSVESIQYAAATDATGEHEVRVRGTETDLCERVLADPDLVEPGFTPLATERETPAGPVDVYGTDADGTPVIVELKRGRAGPDAASQLRRYVDALARDLHADADVRGVLVAPAITNRARRQLAERGLEFAQVAPDAE